ncbi:MAG: hypothetical protein BWY71_00847 [Planctomycetes bacterium ADurb.Bin412]|nr:MAG: hypothetical protein BWY71_00847 [Planctomycetes bacterium ADurb.Bin412]
MNEENLKNLLHQIDRTTSPPPIPAGLAHRVRQKAARQKRWAIAIPSAAAALLVLAATMFILTKNEQPAARPIPNIEKPSLMAENSSVSPAEIARLQTEIDQLKAEADARMKIVQELIALEKKRKTLDELERKLASMKDPLEEVRQQVEKAAFVLVYQADRKLSEYNLRDSALADYHQAVKYFPDTLAAQKARQKITELETSQNLKGDLL